MNDDYLEHYGKMGMRWHKGKKNSSVKEYLSSLGKRAKYTLKLEGKLITHPISTSIIMNRLAREEIDTNMNQINKGKNYIIKSGFLAKRISDIEPLVRQNKMLIAKSYNRGSY